MKLLMNKLGSERTPFIFILDYELKKPIVIPIDDIDSNTCKYKVNEQQNYKTKLVEPNVSITHTPIDKKLYKKAFKEVIHEQTIGNNYLLNLTFATEIKTSNTLNEIFEASTAKYKLLYDNKFVFFSPETFIAVNNGEITSHPMKGTIDAAIPDAKNILLNNKKEDQEHTTIVDLIRNDISQVAKNVKVTRLKYIDEIKTSNKTLLQMSSEIKGKLPMDYNNNIGDIIYKLLPAGSITGAPKKKCIEIIDEVENYDRGYYTGVMGIFDGTNLDSCVMIRFIEKTDNGYYYKSGGGIRIDSNMDHEYEELNDKIYIPIH